MRSRHHPGVHRHRSQTHSSEEVAPASPHWPLFPEAHSTLRFPRSRAAVRCLRTSVSWGLGPRGLAPCRRGCSFRYCSSFDSPRRSSAMSSTEDKVRCSARNGLCSRNLPPDLRTTNPLPYAPAKPVWNFTSSDGVQVGTILQCSLVISKERRSSTRSDRWWLRHCHPLSHNY